MEQTGRHEPRKIIKGSFILATDPTSRVEARLKHVHSPVSTKPGETLVSPRFSRASQEYQHAADFRTLAIGRLKNYLFTMF